MGDDDKATKNLTLRLDQALAERVEALAAIESISIAQVIRSALAEHIERRRQQPEFQSKLRIQLARQAEIGEMFSLETHEDETA